MKESNLLLLNHKLFFVTGAWVILFVNCSPKSYPDTPPVVIPSTVTNEVDFWLTKQDETVKLQKQTGTLAFVKTVNQYASIEVDENTAYQTIDGFGYTLTGGSAEVINSLNATKKAELLQELFGTERCCCQSFY